MSTESYKDDSSLKIDNSQSEISFFSSVKALLDSRESNLINMANLYKNIAEANWSKDKSHSQIFANFLSEISSVQASEMKAGNSEIYLKMRLSYAVTLMESCLGEMLKSVTMQHEQFRRNAINNISQIRESKVSAHELLDGDPQKILDSRIIEHITRILYHNMDKVKKVYAQILDDDFPTFKDGLNDKIVELMDLRHDIVHRNGKKIDGEKIEITPQMVSACIWDIRTFVNSVHGFINQNIEKHKKTD